VATADRTEKVAYAAGGLAMNLTNLVISQWLYPRYVPDLANALVPAGLFAAIFLLGRVTDAVSDPIIAWWSDRSRSPRGRRIPMIRLGLIPLAVTFVLLWTPPFAGAHWMNALWALVFVQLYFLLYGIVITPYLALLPEIVTERADRINLATLQALFVMAGTVAFGLMGLVVAAAGWIGLGVVVAVLTIASLAPTVLRVRERHSPAASTAPRPSLGPWVAATLANRPFVFLLAATSLYWFALNLLLLLVPFWVKEVLGLEEGAVTLVMGPFLGANLAFVFVFNALAKRVGKRAAFLLGLAGTAAAVPLLAVVGKLPFGTDVQQTALVMGIIGIPVASFLMLPYAILADAIDLDERDTGQRREAIYFGVQAIAQKSMIGVSVVAFGWLAYAGDSVKPTREGLDAVALVAALAAAAAFVVFWSHRGAPPAERAH
jgi:GPH family glycoside/pentoside/hexuronide:cation symporter